MMNLKEILENAVMIRNYRTSYSPKNAEITRLWLEKAVLRAGNFEPGMGLVISAEGDVVHIRAAHLLEVQTHKVHKKRGEPLLDVCNRQVDAVLGVGVKIDVVVKDKEIYVYKEMSFEMFKDTHQTDYWNDSSQKFKVLSLFCGGGAMTASFVNTQACEATFAVDTDIPDQNPYDYEEEGKEPGYMSWTIETYRKNFPKSLLYWGDLRSVHPCYIPKADIVLISPPCVEYSGLGAKMKGMIEHFSFHIARIVLESGASAIFFENVPAYFKSKTFEKIKDMLSSVYTEWHQQDIDSYELGAIETRNRGYAVAFREKTNFEFPEVPRIPSSKRKKVSDFIDSTDEEEWSPIKGTVMETFLTTHKSKYAHTGFTADNNNMLVEPTANKVSCFVKGYMKRQTVCSYLKHPKKELWRLFQPKEVMRMMNYPNWFQFPKGISKTRQYEILGNSVNVRPLEAIASCIVSTLSSLKIKKLAEKQSGCLFCS
ncbi:DNA cytosine methyltransferase [Priestia filamentosa]|uniref:DNA cytosine methyltransferase n=1 Tax=Priestia filamentosa TaxID=1402861 RepID=UPI003981CFA9